MELLSPNRRNVSRARILSGLKTLAAKVQIHLKLSKGLMTKLINARQISAKTMIVCQLLTNLIIISI